MQDGNFYKPAWKIQSPFFPELYRNTDSTLTIFCCCLFRLQFTQYGLKHSCFFLVSGLPHETQFSFVRTRFSSQLVLLMLVKTRWTPKVSIALLARNSNIGERAQKDGHAVSTRLFALVSGHICILCCNLYRHTFLPLHL